MAFKLLDDALNSIRQRLYLAISEIPDPAKICIEICPESNVELDMLIDGKTRSFERYSPVMFVDLEYQQILEKTLGSLLEDAKITRNQLGIVFHESAEYHASVDHVAENLVRIATDMKKNGKKPVKIILTGNQQVMAAQSRTIFNITAYMCHDNPEIESAPGIVEM
jgi:adenosine deaminase